MAPRSTAKSERQIVLEKERVGLSVLQWKVASEGSGVEKVEVVRVELAPFSSSTSMFFIQKGTNFAKVFAGWAFAIHSTSW
jgi:hypothetical protein